ncbi:hypothetical protein GCM10029976_009990 [Kribbella albertanoniae]|uniref:PE-PGRS family protein n=1 Tax=Kribbella albertanoniae TaxID=1266829 RepID=A0A4R4Q2S7_9ACTN|nr:hypothetical protein [Kribbella albertanoniae]TDC29280.1 hypothetical protein E1261_16215 [Kribbella albertanoniae]
MKYWDSINERQLGVLKRIAVGEDLSGDENIPARTSANALLNRRLVTIRRSGGRWDAEITEAGTFYLVNGHHPDDPRHQPPATAGLVAPKIRKASKPRTTTVRRPAARPPSTTITDRRRTDAETLIGLLVTERRVSLDVEADGELARWRRVIDFAKRHGMAPVGTRIEKSQPHPGNKLIVELRDGQHPNTNGTRPARTVVPVPEQLRSVHPVIAALRADTQRLMMPKDLRHRSLRIFQALAAEMTRRGHSVQAQSVSEHHVRSGYDWNGRRLEPTYARREGQIAIVIGNNTYAIEIRQESPNSADAEKTRRLLIELSGYHSNGRRHHWADRKRALAEEWLADICDELETRSGEDDLRRIEEAREKAERRRTWEAAIDRARRMATHAHRAAVLTAQAERWQQATAIREYCDALEQLASSTSAEWISWARAHASALDPLSNPPGMPEEPELKPEDLKPYLGRWSPYGPDGDPRDFGWR